MLPRVEDLQWLDSMSAALLARVTATAGRLLAVVTERGAERDLEESTERDELRLQPATRVVTLEPLSSEETVELVRQRLRAAEVSQDILTLVLDRVTGHPFFCEALLETMIQSGAIRVSGDGAQLAGVTPVDVPASVESAVLSRLDRLEASQQLALKAAAVVGRTFSVAEVAATHPTAQLEEVGDQLELLCELDLLARRHTGARAMYEFRHQIIQDVAYGLLTDAQRRPMHRAAAGWYESTQAERRAPAPARLAHHWLQAGEQGKAAPYLEQAGLEALGAGAFAEAVAFIEQSILTQPHLSPERRALQEKSLADAHYFLGDLPRSRALLEQALERMGHPIPAGRLELARALSAAAMEQLRHLLLPRRYLGTRASERDTMRAAVDAMRTLVQISYLHASSSLELTYLVINGLNLGELVGPSPELARSLANASALAGLMNLQRRADRYAQRAVEMAEQTEHSPASAYVWNVIAIMHAGRGHWREALDGNDRALERFGSVGDYNLESELWQTRSALQLCRGTLAQAEPAWTRTRELAQRTGSRVNLCLSLLDEAQTEVARGRLDRGAVALEAALEIPIVDSDGGTVIERRATAALVRLDQGRHAEAVAQADAVVDMLSNTLPTGWVWAEFGAMAVEVLLELLASEEPGVPRRRLERRIKRGLSSLRRLSITFGGIRVRVLVLRARTARLAGERQTAEGLLQRAEAACQREDQTHDRARVGILRAELSEDRDTRARLVVEPLRALETLGQERERRRAEELAK